MAGPDIPKRKRRAMDGNRNVIEAGVRGTAAWPAERTARMAGPGIPKRKRRAMDGNRNVIEAGVRGTAAWPAGPPATMRGIDSRADAIYKATATVFQRPDTVRTFEVQDGSSIDRYRSHLNAKYNPQIAARATRSPAVPALRQ